MLRRRGRRLRHPGRQSRTNGRPRPIARRRRGPSSAPPSPTCWSPPWTTSTSTRWPKAAWRRGAPDLSRRPRACRRRQLCPRPRRCLTALGALPTSHLLTRSANHWPLRDSGGEMVRHVATPFVANQSRCSRALGRPKRSCPTVAIPGVAPRSYRCRGFEMSPKSDTATCSAPDKQSDRVDAGGRGPYWASAHVDAGAGGRLLSVEGARAVSP